MKKRYTIEEINVYLNGWCLVEKEGENNPSNDMLKNSINQIEDSEDGIEAVLLRNGLRKKEVHCYECQHRIHCNNGYGCGVFQTNKNNVYETTRQVYASCKDVNKNGDCQYFEPPEKMSRGCLTSVIIGVVIGIVLFVKFVMWMGGS